MDTCSHPLKINCWIVSPELMSLKNLLSHDNRILGWKAVCGKAPGRCTAGLAPLPSSCASEEPLQPSPGLRGWPSQSEATARPLEPTLPWGRPAKADHRSWHCSAGIAAPLVFSLSSLTRSMEERFPSSGITRNYFVHLINFPPLGKI